MNKTKKQKRNPWSFIPTQYFAEGLPYVIVNDFSVTMLKALQVSNELIGYTSFLYLPWAVKLFWAPVVDGKATKRGWVISMQIVLAILMFCLGFSITLPSFFYVALAVLTLISFASATHDIATDGFYLHALGNKDQAFFTGIRSTFYRISMIFGGGILVYIAGEMTSQSSSAEFGWTVALLIASGLFFLMYLYHKWILPRPQSDGISSETKSLPYKEIFAEYFTQKKIYVILSFILLYRFGEGLLVKMARPFLMDPVEHGGLNISVSEVGIMYGTIGVLLLVIGGILGGVMVKKYSLKTLIWPMALAMNLPNLLYVYLAYTQPTDLTVLNLPFSWEITINPIVQACIALEQFGYGFGFTGFMVYLLYISKGKYKTSLYAISTGIMAVGMMIPGFISGWLQMQIGYQWLFICSSIMTLPGMMIIFFLPFEFKEEKK